MRPAPLLAGQICCHMRRDRASHLVLPLMLRSSKCCHALWTSRSPELHLVHGHAVVLGGVVACAGQAGAAAAGVALERWPAAWHCCAAHITGHWAAGCVRGIAQQGPEHLVALGSEACPPEPGARAGIGCWGREEDSCCGGGGVGLCSVPRAAVAATRAAEQPPERRRHSSRGLASGPASTGCNRDGAPPPGPSRRLRCWTRWWACRRLAAAMLLSHSSLRACGRA